VLLSTPWDFSLHYKKISELKLFHLGTSGRIILKWILRKWYWRNLTDVAQDRGPVAGSCEDRNEHWGEFLHQLRECQLPKDSAPCSLIRLEWGGCIKHPSHHNHHLIYSRLLELLAPCGGTPELLAPWEVTLIVRFLTTGVTLPPRSLWLVTAMFNCWFKYLNLQWNVLKVWNEQI
jgi:hypothetical protein